MIWWKVFQNHVRKVVLENEPQDRHDISYWRNNAFCEILTYLTPLSLIALVPSVYMAFKSGIPIIGYSDLLTFFIIVLITLVPGISLRIRKAVFIFILYCLTLTLLYFLPMPGPGILFSLAVTIFSSLIYSSNAAYFSASINTFICVGFALLIHFGLETTVSSVNTLGSWIAVSSNLVLLSFACAKCLDLLLSGLTKSLKDNKVSEAKLEKANRLYQFISQINQTIVHVKDAKTLFRKSCHIAVEFGNYKMAWIGGFDTVNQRITILDSCGITEQDIQLFTNIPFNTSGPQVKVLRTGTYYLCNDLINANSIESWKPVADKQNIRSVIVLPIKKSGKVFGTLNLYASEPNSFLEDDIALLNEVTGDISFALDIFEQAEKHKEAELQLHKNFEELEAASNELTAILNTIPASIALLDNDSNIVKVNEEWIHFGQSNGMQNIYPHVGKNYIEVSEKALGLETEDGKHMTQGLRDITNGSKPYFTMEYPCDSPSEKRWFKAEVRPFKSSLLTGAVVMHINITERKMAEAEMLLLINNTEEAFVLVDRDLEIISFNNRLKHLYATHFGQNIKKGVCILEYAQSDRKKIAASIYKKVLKGHVEKSVIKFPGPNNTTIYYSLKYSPAKDDTGAIFGAFVTGKDITSKKKAKNQKEFERRNKEALINSTEDLIWSVSTDYKLIAANNAFVNEMKEFTGVDIKQGEDILSFNNIPEESLKYWEEFYQRALLGKSFKMEIYNPPSPGRDESWIDTSFNPIIVNEQITGIACYSRNITERKKAENQLIRASTAWQHAVNDLNKVMDSSLDVICAVDADGIFLKVSAASKTVWGYTPEELIGTPIFKLVYHEDLEKTRVSAKTVMSGNKLNHFENRYVRKDGTLVTLEWNARWDAKDQIRYGVARDVSEKKRLQDAIENERQRFYDLFSDAPSSMGVLRGPDHVFEIVNPLYLELIGKKDIIGKTFKEVLPEAVDQGFIDILDSVYKTGKTFSSSEMLIKLDTLGTGQLVDKYLNFMYQAHRTEKNIIDGILFFAIDVTEQVVLRKKIEDSEAKLKKAQALLQISNWEIDLINYINTWSDECYDIIGWRREDLEPSLQAFLSLIHPDDFELANAMVVETFQTYDAGSFSARIQTKMGDIKYVYCEWKFEFDINAKPIRIYGILQDITERKKSEHENKFKAQLLDTIGQSVIATDLNGKVTFWNKAAVNTYGWTLEEALGTNILKLTPSDKALEEAEMLMSKLSQGESWSGEFYVRRKNGDIFPAFVSNSSVNDEFGKQIGIIGVSNDISERKQFEEERSKITKELLQRNRDLEQFTFIISHNLRAPAANIMGFTEYLQDDTTTPQEHKELLKGLATSVSGLDTIIKDINSILQAKREINDKKETIRFSNIVTNVINSIGTTIDKNHVTIKTDFDEVDEIFSLKVYLHSIFYNLISNSIKYRSLDKQALIEIKSKREKDKIILTFEDNGMGIDMTKKGDKVFGLYQRFHNHVEGKGLGLFMVKTQVEAIGGKISVASELHKGTEFTIIFEN